MSNSLYKLYFAVSAVLVAGFMLGMVPRGDTSLPAKPSAVPGRVRESAERIDKLMEESWAMMNVQPLEPAETLAVLRRLSLALCGTIPSLEEIRQLEKLPAEGQIEAHLENLLADRRFADYFAERLARTFVGNDEGPFLVYRRRRFVYWLSDQLHANRPYDDLVRELISAEGLWTDRPATNFVTARVIPDKGPDPMALASRTTRAFLGIRIDCAQCHDHPFTDWKQSDFEGLAAFFAQTRTSLRGIEDRDGELKVEDMRTKEEREVSPRVPFAAETGSPDGSRRQQLARWVTGEKYHNDPDGKAHDYFAEAIANRVWTLLFGQGIAEPVDDLEAPRRLPGVLEVLGTDFRAHGHDLRRLIRVIAATRAFRMSAGNGQAVTENQEESFAVFPMTRLRSEQIAGSLVQASSLQTVDADSHIVVRAMRFFGTIDFIKHYGDAGEEELDAHVGTIPQRLVMMNGKMPRERINASPFNAAGRISRLAPSDESRVRVAYLVALTRPPSPEELTHFTARLRDLKAKDKHTAIEDLLWALINSTEFSWNH